MTYKKSSPCGRGFFGGICSSYLFNLGELHATGRLQS